MTIATQVNKVTAAGNDVATVFSFSPMVIYGPNDLVVVVTTAAGVQTVIDRGATDTTYSLDITTFPNTGSITYPAVGGTPLVTGSSITIKRQLTLEQLTDLENQGGYLPEVQEMQLDKIVAQNLQQQETIDRTLRLPVFYSGTQVSTVLPAPVAGKVIRLNDAGTEFEWVTGGATGATGPTGPSEVLARWLFDTSTTMADPGTGDIRFNNAAVGSTTAIAVSALSSDSGNPDISNFIATWDDSTSATKGTIILRKVGALATYAVFNITGAVTDNGAWLQIAVTHVASSGTWSASDAMVMDFARTGNDGSGAVTSVTGTAPIASSGGATPAISLNDAGVTYAKIQNVTATDRLLGRSTAGAGVVEEITCTAAGRALLDDASATAQRATLDAAALATANTFTAKNNFNSGSGRIVAPVGADKWAT